MAIIVPLVTRNDLDNIKSYVRKGQSLPLTEAAIVQGFPSASSSHVDAFLENYKKIKKHADTWQSVESSMQQVSATLIAFANDVHEYCDGEEGAITVIEALEGYTARKLDTMTQEELEALPEIAFGNDDALTGADANQLPTLTETVTYLKDSITQKRLSSNAALGTLKKFQTELNPIKAWVGEKVQAFLTTERDQQIHDKFSALIKFDGELKIWNAEKKQELELNFKNASMFLLGGAAGGLLYFLKSARLEGISEENKKRRDSMLKEIEDANVIRGQVLSLHLALQSLYDVVDSAVKGVIHLHSHWDVVIALIDDSKAHFSTKASYATLGKFVGKLKLVAEDWGVIRMHSEKLQGAMRLKTD